mgnify:FL=1
MGVKFENMDILDALGKIMELHTKHYKDDFELNKELIPKLAASENTEDRRLLWMSRPCGTYTLRERDVYLQDSHENKVWDFYYEQTKDPILAYALNLKGIRDGKVPGDIYPLDYGAHVERTKLLTCPITQVTMFFEDGASAVLPYASRRQKINKLMPEHGAPKSMYYAPESERELSLILVRERLKREHHASPGNFKEYLEKLEKGTLRAQLQARRTTVPSPGKSAPHKGTPER